MTEVRSPDIDPGTFSRSEDQPLCNILTIPMQMNEYANNEISHCFYLRRVCEHGSPMALPYGREITTAIA